MRTDTEDRIIAEMTRLNENIESFTQNMGDSSVKSSAYQTALIESLAKMNSTIELMVSSMNNTGNGGTNLPPSPSPQRPFKVIRMDDYGITIQKY